MPEIDETTLQKYLSEHDVTVAYGLLNDKESNIKVLNEESQRAFFALAIEYITSQQRILDVDALVHNAMALGLSDIGAQIVKANLRNQRFFAINKEEQTKEALILLPSRALSATQINAYLTNGVDPTILFKEAYNLSELDIMHLIISQKEIEVNFLAGVTGYNLLFKACDEKNIKAIDRYLKNGTEYNYYDSLLESIVEKPDAQILNVLIKHVPLKNIISSAIESSSVHQMIDILPSLTFGNITGDTKEAEHLLEEFIKGKGTPEDAEAFKEVKKRKQNTIELVEKPTLSVEDIDKGLQEGIFVRSLLYYLIQQQKNDLAIHLLKSQPDLIIDAFEMAMTLNNEPFVRESAEGLKNKISKENLHASLKEAMRGRDLDKIQFIIKLGADLSMNNNELLEIAFNSGMHDVVKILCENRATLSQAQIQLHLVQIYSNLEASLDALKSLLYNMGIEIPEERHVDLMEIAFRKKDYELLEMLREVEKKVCFEKAIETSDYDIIKYLLTKGFNPFKQGYDPNSDLMKKFKKKYVTHFLAKNDKNALLLFYTLWASDKTDIELNLGELSKKEIEMLESINKITAVSTDQTMLNTLQILKEVKSENFVFNKEYFADKKIDIKVLLSYASNAFITFLSNNPEVFGLDPGELFKIALLNNKQNIVDALIDYFKKDHVKNVKVDPVAIHMFIATNKLEDIKKLFAPELAAKMPIDINYVYSEVGKDYYHSALSYAIESKNGELIDFILRRPNVDVKTPDNKPLFYALKNGLYKVAEIIQAKDPNARLTDEQRETLIAEAFKESNTTLLKKLVIDKQFLLKKARKESKYALITALIKDGFDLIYQDEPGVIPAEMKSYFTYLAKSGNESDFQAFLLLVKDPIMLNKFLLDANIDLNETLLSAVKAHPLLTPQTLRSLQAALDVANNKLTESKIREYFNEGINVDYVLDVALKHDSTTFIEYLLNPDNKQSFDIQVLFNKAVEKKAFNSTKMLISYIDKHVDKPVSFPKEGVVEFFMNMDLKVCENVLKSKKYIVDINYFDLFYNNLLTNAISYEKTELVKLLLERPDIDIRARDDNPLYYALLHDLNDIADELFKRGSTLTSYNVRKLEKEALQKKQYQKVEKLRRMFKNVYEEGSLFVHPFEFRKAAIHAHQHYLSTPYTSGSNVIRWENQRAIALLVEGAVMDVPPECLIGVVEAQSLAQKKEQQYERLINTEAEKIKERTGLTWEEARKKAYDPVFNQLRDKIVALGGKSLKTEEEIIAESERIINERMERVESAVERAEIRYQEELVRKVVIDALKNNQTVTKAYAIIKAKELLTKLVTLDEIAKFYPHINRADIGKVNIEKFEAVYGPVSKILYRPNHDLAHSIRVAALILPLYLSLNSGQKTNDVNSELDKSELEKLQLMMLFSVLGREDETGFSDSTTKEGSFMYQSYRAISAVEFLKYCLEHWEYYQQIFKNKEALYQAALVVELMGYPDLPLMNPPPARLDLEGIKPTPIVYMLMKGDVDINFLKLLHIIKTEYPTTNQLRSYTEDENKLKALFLDAPVENMTPNTSETYLHYMNHAHGTDLLRVYQLEPQKDDKANTLEHMEDYFVDLYRAQRHKNTLGKVSLAKPFFDYISFARQMLNAFGEKRTTDIETYRFGAGTVLDLADSMLEFLINHVDTPMTFKELEKINAEKGLNILEVIKKVSQNDDAKTKRQKWGLIDEEGNQNTFTPSHENIPKIISHYICLELMRTNYTSITAERFESCHYKPLGKHERRDFNDFDHTREVDSTMRIIDWLERPELARKTEYQEASFYEIHVRSFIEKSCGEGITVKQGANKTTLEFSSKENAEKIFTLLNEFYHIKMPTIIEQTDPPHVDVEIDNEDFNLISSYFKYRLPQTPKYHHVEDDLVLPTGEIAIFHLIDNYEALACNQDSRINETSHISGVEWYLNQLENPSTNRPLKNPELSASQRSKTLNLQKLDTTDPTIEWRRRYFTESYPLQNIPPVTTPPSPEGYYESDGTLRVKNVSETRGLSSTEYAKKSSHTLLGQRGMRLFPGGGLYPRYYPIAFISGIKKVHTHGDQYIWSQNVVSNDRFWIEGKVKTEELIGMGRGTLTREKLIANLKQKDADPANPEVMQWNELLIGGKKTALSAIACGGDMCFGDQTTLTHRLNMVTQALEIKDKFGIEVPMILIEINKPPVLYTEEMLLKDIEEAIAGLAPGGKYPYMDKSHERYRDPGPGYFGGFYEGYYKLRCNEQRVIVEFFQKIREMMNLPQISPPDLTLYETKNEYYAKYPSATQSYEDYIKAIDEENDKKMQAYFSQIKLQSINAKELVVDKLKLMGNEARENDYLKKRLEASAFGNPEVYNYLLKRNIALGHVNNVKEILEHAEENKIDLNLTTIKDVPKNIQKLLTSHQEKAAARVKGPLLIERPEVHTEEIPAQPLPPHERPGPEAK